MSSRFSVNLDPHPRDQLCAYMFKTQETWLDAQVWTKLLQETDAPFRFGCKNRSQAWTGLQTLIETQVNEVKHHLTHTWVLGEKQQI